MASGDDGKSSWWDWNSIVQSAKEKTMSTLEIVKSDFSEFTNVMSSDTTNLIYTATAKFVEKSNNASYLLDTFDNKVKIETNNRLKTSSTVQERYENELKAIQLNEATYLNDPEQTDEFVAWQGSFNPDTNKTTISDLLIENSSMRLIYSKLVPAKTSNEQFWCRYFYKINLFEEEQKKRIKLLERVKENAKNEESVDWDEDEDEDTKTIDNSENTTSDHDNSTSRETTADTKESKNRTKSEADDIVEEISKELTGLNVKEENSDVLKEVSDNSSENEGVEIIKMVKSMVTSIRTEDSKAICDDWDKLDTSDNNESDCEKIKAQGTTNVNKDKTASKTSTKTAAELKDKSENSDDWDDWGE